MLEHQGDPVLTAVTGTNADLLARAFRLYIPPGSAVIDATYGKGIFWQRIDRTQYDTYINDPKDPAPEDPPDLHRHTLGTIALNLGVSYTTCYRKWDAFILDPPYMHGGKTVKPSINDCYRNANTTHTSIVRMYAMGLLEAAKLLRKGGLVLVKCQDEIESGRQQWTHVELMDLLKAFGYVLRDMFVLVQTGKPAMREGYQHTARKNHSYLLIGEYRG